MGSSEPNGGTAVDIDARTAPGERAPGPIRVVVVDDHPGFREALGELLKLAPELVVVGQADGVESALTLLERVSADVVVVDLRMPAGGGQRLVEQLTARRHPARLVATSASATRSQVAEVLTAGAYAFLPKSSAATDWIELLGRLGARPDARGGTPCRADGPPAG